MHKRILPLVLLALLALAVMAPSASAHGTSGGFARATTGPTPFGGREWNVRVIRVYDATPPLYREGVNIALRSWNEARLGVSFARTKRRDRAHVVISTKRFPGMVAGDATLGMTPGARVRLDTALVAVKNWQVGNTIFDIAHGAMPEEIAEVAAHELGHVLGLQHTGGCSLMAPAALSGSACRYKPPAKHWVCRLPQQRDLATLKRRYGGRGIVRANPYCLVSATPAGPVGPIKAAPSTRERPVELTWDDATNSYGFVIARSAPGGGCPASPDAGAAKAELDFGKHTEYWGAGGVAQEAGRYCYSIWSRNGRGRLTGPRRIFVDVRPPVIAPISNLQASVGPAVDGESTVGFTWTQPAGTTVVRIYRGDPAHGCVVPVDFSPVAYAEGGATSASDTYVPPGTYTYVATRSQEPDDREDYAVQPAWRSAPVCTTVTVP